jgi:hypothetical protein
MTTTYKSCTKCGRELPRTSEHFCRDSSKPDGLHPWCKSCRSANARAFRKANPELVKERSDRWRKENPEYRKSEYWLEWDRKYCRENREKKTENQRRYRAENPERYRAYCRNYQAQKRANGGHVSAAELREQYERQGGRCYWCSVEVGDDFHLDHVIPLKRGGLHQIDNIVVSCPFCNASKHDKLPYTEWIPQNPL